MNLFADAIAWIFSPDRATGALPLSEAIGTHLAFTAVAVLLAALLAVPAGWVIGHTGRGREFAVALSGAARAVPSFGLVLLLVLLLGVTHKVAASTTAFVLLAVPPILAGAYTGVEAVDRRVVDGARSVGMTPGQVLRKVEVPLGLPLLIGGLRSATLQVVATVTLAGYVGSWGLGFYIVQGIQLRDFSQILGAALVIVVLAVVLDLLFALLERAVVPRGVSARRAEQSDPARRRRRREVATSAT
ncbi:ABC transporter permease [Isoptericola cucumis]|uniref:ABC transporter permease n=1 Tax=Isoptericola cucumis TaxID=1776856 RepID=A0ABQ2B6M6_9MICO|nr:ABC transporter permease subunit [Isoptericola cucumis]GGI07457.1 ABC transporter permease [Isoptericola cucumis]